MAPPVTLYWRPGCPYCRRLRGDLRRVGLPVREVDIWQDQAAAARLRAVAGGNETVPTVLVGAEALVNPSASAVVAALRRADPTYVAASGLERAAHTVRVLRAARWVLLAALVVASFVIEDTGHPAASWAFDGAAAVVWAVAWFGFRRRTPRRSAFRRRQQVRSGQPDGPHGRR